MGPASPSTPPTFAPPPPAPFVGDPFAAGVEHPRREGGLLACVHPDGSDRVDDRRDPGDGSFVPRELLARATVDLREPGVSHGRADFVAPMADRNPELQTCKNREIFPNLPLRRLE